MMAKVRICFSRRKCYHDASTEDMSAPQFQEQVKAVDFLERVFYYRPNKADSFAGGSRFVNDWPMKEMLMRSMKNER